MLVEENLMKKFLVDEKVWLEEQAKKAEENAGN
jgi:hypothetical protein